MKTAIYYASDAYKIGQNQIMGRRVAGNSFLKAYFEYINSTEFWVYSRTKAEAEEFFSLARKIGRKEEVKFINYNNPAALKEADILFYPGPDIYKQSNNRSFFKDNSWSICGITHTTSSAQVMESIKSLVTSPVNQWDAVICTSQAVKSNVNKILDIEEENLRNRLKATQFIRPQLPVIPLGIDTDDFKFTKEDRINARKNFHIDENEFVVLYVGRLSFHAKANPFPMYKSLETVANKSNRKLVLIECGWYANKGIQDAFIQAANKLCPNIKVLRVDGSQNDLKLKSFAAADLFCSLSDNIQETFGITPIEAMAAGLPVIVSDWNGYKDTVRDGLDGYRIPTLMPPPGYGSDLALRYAMDIDNYDMYIGNISNLISINSSLLNNALYQILTNDKLRIDMANNARKRVIDNFDWSKIIPKYEKLWSDLNTARKKSSNINYMYTSSIDPFLGFYSYPTNIISRHSVISLIESSIDKTIKKLKIAKDLYIVNYSRYTLPGDTLLIKLINNINQEGKNKTVEMIKEEFRELGIIELTRILLWLHKFDIIKIE